MSKHPAFPTEEQDGMTLRDYFAAHAPEYRASWFRFKFDVPAPEFPQGAAWCKSCDAGCDCEETESCKAMRDYKDRQVAWEDAWIRASDVAWRYAWADAMLEARQK